MMRWALAAIAIGVLAIAAKSQTTTSGVSKPSYKSIDAGYTVSPDDAGAILAAAGGFYHVKLGPASEYGPGFTATLINDDPVRLKFLEYPDLPLGGVYVCPRSTVRFIASLTLWHVEGVHRCKLPGGQTIVHTDSTNGSDTYGATDGFGTGADAYKSVEHGLYMLYDQFDFSGLEYAQTSAVVQMAPGSLDTEMVHVSPHGFVGAQGGWAVVIDMNGGTLDGTMQVYFGTVLQLRNGTISASQGGNAIAVLNGGYLYIADNVTFGALKAGGGGSEIVVANNAVVQLENNFNWAVGGDASTSFANVGVGGILESSGTIQGTLLTNITVGSIVRKADGGLDVSSIAWAPTGHAFSY